MVEAEGYSRKAVKANPENIQCNYWLGRILIEGNNNIEEGMGYINKALKSLPIMYSYFTGWRKRILN